MESYDLGAKGEEIAKKYLISIGHEILEKQWRYNKAEVDLISMIDGVLIFIEVKTRTSEYFGPPEEFVTAKKQRLMTAAASAYMQKIGHEWTIRFDIISIIIPSENKHSVHHFKDAFFLGL